MNKQTTENGRVGDNLNSLVSLDELRLVSDLTIDLTRLRQEHCKHLCIENYAPELFHKLLTRMTMHKQGVLIMDEGGLSKEG